MVTHVPPKAHPKGKDALVCRFSENLLRECIPTNMFRVEQAGVTVDGVATKPKGKNLPTVPSGAPMVFPFDSYPNMSWDECKKKVADLSKVVNGKSSADPTWRASRTDEESRCARIFGATTLPHVDFSRQVKRDFGTTVLAIIFEDCIIESYRAKLLESPACQALRRVTMRP